MQYCSDCGAKLEHLIPPDDDRPRYVCPSCKRVHYQNPLMVVGCIPEWKDQILMCRRDIEPKKGKWTLPAGYLENGETVEAAARRETREETGADVESLTPYLMFDIPSINQIYFMFRGHLKTTAFHPTRESSEVVLVKESDIPWNDIAFRVIEEALRSYFKDRSAGGFRFRIDQIHKDSFPGHRPQT